MLLVISASSRKRDVSVNESFGSSQNPPGGVKCLVSISSRSYDIKVEELYNKSTLAGKKTYRLVICPLEKIISQL